VDGIAARQTRHNKEAFSIPEFGYLSADRDPEIVTIDKTSPASSSERISISAKLVIVATLIVSLISSF